MSKSNNIVTPSLAPISIGQIGKIHELLDAALRKGNLPRDGVQNVLAHQGKALIDEFISSLRRRAEAESEMIIRRVRVNRALNSEQVIKETGRVRGYVDTDVLITLPEGEGEEVDVYFFPLKKFLPVSQYDQELAKHELVADPRAQAAVNRDDPEFADEHPNGVQWGKDFCAVFYRWLGERRVDVFRRDRDNDWGDSWWFAGVRKPDTR
ncbi:hypothetical protein HYW73_00845 [Candidatus Nomurabacteria bacterium]|nr:hypothetical protein [Candidatus Nomurabacteria bacterium]